MDKDFILESLRQLKPKYERDGIILLGLFGSYARDNSHETSDIDILIETTPKFLKMYKGFHAFSKLDDIKQELKDRFKKDIDLVDKVGLLQHNNTYILDKTLYV